MWRAVLALFLASQSAAPDLRSVAAEGQNTYFILKPGYRLVLEGREDGRPVRLVVTVLNETRVVGGASTRVVEERETSGGELIEVSRNYFAFDAATSDVLYFGEDVDVYKRGAGVSHEGSWRAGTKGARPGLMMPGTPAVGMRHDQERAPGIAMDHAEIVSLTERVTTPAGTFERCLRTKETTPLEKGAVEYKVYAPGIGLIQDGSLKLVSHEYVR